MGNLLQTGLPKRHTLDTRVLIGRSRKCDLRLTHPSVSGEHAIVWWTGAGWSIRELGSRNGTLVSGTPLAPGQPRALAAGDTLSFGHYPITWTVESTAPPLPRAVRLDAPGEVSAEGGMIVLPPDAPLAMLYADPLQGWVVESDDGSRAVEDLETLTLDGSAWRLHLPSGLSSTIGLDPEIALMGQIALTFVVSADEEHVQLLAAHGERRHELGSRSHNYALLTLARARLQDAEDGNLSDGEQGWLYQDDLTRMLQISRTQLNLLIFRARKQLAGLDIDNARDIVERRPDSRQLRIGTGLLRVETT